MNELMVFENSIQPLVPRFGQVLGTIMPVERFMRTLYTACETTPKLLKADRQSLLNAAMTGAVLGLEADGATGQFFLLPFEMRKLNRIIVQPVIGYKGFNTIGARSGLTIAGGVVRERDDFDYDEGSKPFVHHKRKLGDEKDRRIYAAWATAVSRDRPPIVKVLSIDDIMAVKAKSPRGNEAPWADPAVGFPAMAEKTAKRRLARDMPLTLFQRAARMEEAFEEQQRVSYIHPERGVVDSAGDVIAPNHSDVTPTFEDLTDPPDVLTRARLAATNGKEAFRALWRSLNTEDRATLKPHMESLQQAAETADNDQTEAR